MRWISRSIVDRERSVSHHSLYEIYATWAAFVKNDVLGRSHMAYYRPSTHRIWAGAGSAIFVRCLVLLSLDTPISFFSNLVDKVVCI